MKVKILVILLVMLVVTVGIFVMNKSNQVSDNADKQDIVEAPPEVNLDTVEIAIGKPTPDFTLKDLNGEDVSLSDYKGQYVLINFWATWCGYCDMEMPDLEKFDEENEDLVVLAVDVKEKLSDVADYISKNGYDFKVVLDSEGKTANTYKVSGFPTSYFVDKEGLLLGVVPGMMDIEKMNEIFNQVK